MTERKFVELQNELFSLFETGSFDEVHSLINKAQKAFPDRPDKTNFWKACVLAVEGKSDEAVAILDKSLGKGVWWNPDTLRRDPDLRTLQNNDNFKLVLKKCEEILEQQRLSAESKLFVYGNQLADKGIFSLHWRGSNVKDFSSYWFNDNLLSTYLFGFPQSSQVYGFNAYCWDDQEMALSDIQREYNDFKMSNNTQKVILTGASQGGKLVIELSLKNSPMGANGFIAVIPAIQDVSSIERIIETNNVNHLRGCIITGDQDPFYQKTLELMPIFERHGIQCKWVVKEGLGHFFPNDFVNILPEAVDYVLESDVD